jgi:hypothetical protein
MASRVLMDNALAEYRKSGRWALSVGASPSLTGDAIAREWPYEGRHYSPSTAAAIEDAGFRLIPDPPPPEHWLLMLGWESVEESTQVAEETWNRLCSCFGQEMPNPNWRGFKRDGNGQRN